MTLTFGVSNPAREKAALSDASGVSRLRWISLLRARSGETYRTRHVPHGKRPVRRLSIAQRNAARVFPEPVGATTRTCFPAAIAGQACFWASVACPIWFANQDCTMGWKGESGIVGWGHVSIDCRVGAALLQRRPRRRPRCRKRSSFCNVPPGNYDGPRLRTKRRNPFSHSPTKLVTRKQIFLDRDKLDR